MSKLKLVLDESERDDICLAKIDRPGHLAAAEVVVRFEHDKEDNPSLVQFARDLVDAYNERPVPEPASSTSAADILKAAAGHMQDRAATYDAPAGERSMGKTVAMFNALYGLELTEEQGWAFMKLHEISKDTR